MIVVGLTGGIATGKSTVAAMLAARGAAVVDADRIARTLQEPGQPCLRQIVEAFGTEVVGADGRLDRLRLAGLVFGDAAARRRLEAIMHPAIRQTVSAELWRAEAAGASVGVVEAALILEAGQRERYDCLVVVAAPAEVQLERLMRQRGLGEAEARRRIAAQWTTERKAALADYVIDNGGEPAATAAQVDALLAALAGRMSAPADGGAKRA
ncbi:MAG: dephospho-CoA kinase [candidate division NC10 bacterium]|nr:dephospho-CoA kinase [candidate division NC10 bacterium]